MELLRLPFLLILTLTATQMAVSSAQKPFTCKSDTTTTCHALIEYVSPNTTTISSIRTLFGVKNLRTILGVNNLPLSTPQTQTVNQKEKIVIPFPCICSNGTGISNKRPQYAVKTGDTLYHIAAEVFSGLVTYQKIGAVNNIVNLDEIELGNLWIPLPCSCDDVAGEKVVHYGHVVDAGSSVSVIAEKYGTSPDTLLTLNNMTNASDLLAGQVLDVPLKACTSMINNTSLDYPLLVSNGTYVFTANNCVKCKCDSANNYTLQCEQSQLNSSTWKSCPSMQCEGSDNLVLGNATSASCPKTTCAYAGYTNQTILTTLVESTCTNSDNKSSATSLQGLSWSLLFIVISLFLVYINL